MCLCFLILCCHLKVVVSNVMRRAGMEYLCQPWKLNSTHGCDDSNVVISLKLIFVKPYYQNILESESHFDTEEDEIQDRFGEMERSTSFAGKLLLNATTLKELMKHKEEYMLIVLFISLQVESTPHWQKAWGPLQQQVLWTDSHMARPLTDHKSSCLSGIPALPTILMGILIKLLFQLGLSCFDSLPSTHAF